MRYIIYEAKSVGWSRGDAATSWGGDHKTHTRPSGQGRLQGGREPAAHLQNCPGGSLAAPGRPGSPCTAGLLLLLALSMPSRTRPFSAYPNTGAVLVSIRFPGQVAYVEKRQKKGEAKNKQEKSSSTKPKRLRGTSQKVCICAYQVLKTQSPADVSQERGLLPRPTSYYLPLPMWSQPSRQRNARYQIWSSPLCPLERLALRCHIGPFLATSEPTLGLAEPPRAHRKLVPKLSHVGLEIFEGVIGGLPGG
jgi:hypothetical protein